MYYIACGRLRLRSLLLYQLGLIIYPHVLAIEHRQVVVACLGMAYITTTTVYTCLSKLVRYSNVVP